MSTSPTRDRNTFGIPLPTADYTDGHRRLDTCPGPARPRTPDPGPPRDGPPARRRRVSEIEVWSWVFGFVCGCFGFVMLLVAAKVLGYSR